MENKSKAIASLILLIALFASAQAQLTIPKLFPPVSPIDPTKCWSSLLNVQGCVLEIYKSVSSGQIGTVGPACCKAFSTIDANCWPHMFPLNPFFPTLLKDSCARIAPISPGHK